MAQILSGSRAIFKLGVQGGTADKIGYAFGVDIDEEIMHEEVQTLDSLSVTEHVPVAYRVNMSAEVFKTIPSVAAISASNAENTSQGVSATSGTSASLKVKGYMPKMGINDAAALQQAVLTATLFDGGAGSALLGTVTGCRIASARFSLRARQIVAENVRFVCQRFKEGSET